MRVKGYKYRIYPNATQEHELDFMLWKLRNLWNRALQLRRYHYNRWGKQLYASQMKKHFCNVLRKRHPDTYGVLTYDTVSNMLYNMDEAFKRFHKNLRDGLEYNKAGHPHFKRRGAESGLMFRTGIGLIHPITGKRFSAIRSSKPLEPDQGYTGDVEYKGRYLHIRYLSMPLVRIHFHRGLPADFETVQYATITSEQGKWHISFAVRDKGGDYPAPQPNPQTALGIDIGLKYLISSSSGRQEEHPDWLSQGLPHLRRLERKIGRQKRANNPHNYDENGVLLPPAKREEEVVSGNMRRTRADIARLSERLKNQRRYFWETYTDEITKQYSVIVIEDLTPKFMLTMKQLARKVTDAAIGFFRNRLEHKCRERGVMLIRVAPHYTSQQCYVCKHTVAENRLDQTQFKCRNCGQEDHADLNAAYNIRDRGLDQINKAYAWFTINPAALQEIAETPTESTCAKHLRDAGVHHWTTLEQVARCIAVAKQM